MTYLESGCDWGTVAISDGLYVERSVHRRHREMAWSESPYDTQDAKVGGVGGRGGVVAEETEIDNLASALSSTLAPPYSHWQALASAEEVF